MAEAARPTLAESLTPAVLGRLAAAPAGLTLWELFVSIHPACHSEFPIRKVLLRLTADGRACARREWRESVIVLHSGRRLARSFLTTIFYAGPRPPGGPDLTRGPR